MLLVKNSCRTIMIKSVVSKLDYEINMYKRIITINIQATYGELLSIKFFFS